MIEGATGLIIVDPLGSVGAARASLDLYLAHRPKRPVVAVIYTHSHSDHYGGVRGVAEDADVAAGRTSIIAPAGFMNAVIAESVVAGNAMGRRAAYQFGASLPRGERGSVDAGLGKIDGVGAPGRSVMAPTIWAPRSSNSVPTPTSSSRSITGPRGGESASRAPWGISVTPTSTSTIRACG